MSLVPAFEIGLWNGWILQGFFLLTMFVQDFVMGKEAKKRTSRLNQFVPFGKTEKILAYSTHVVIMPLVLLYSIFVPLKLGTPWLYVGLAILALSVVMYIMAILNAAGTSVGEPVTRGVYRITRHPIYLGAFLLYIGTGIACASWVILLCAVLWITIWHIVVPTEEGFCVEKYGDVYREYMARTPRWLGIPKST